MWSSLAKDRQGWRSLTAAFTSEMVVIYLLVPRCSAIDGCGEHGDDAKQAVRAGRCKRSMLPNHDGALYLRMQQPPRCEQAILQQRIFSVKGFLFVSYKVAVALPF